MLNTSEETWRHREIITNGIRLHYVIQGEGPLIVLLHGFPEYWYSWRYQIPFLAELGYTVVAPDLRGYNDSDKPRRGYDIATLIGDIEGLIKGLDYERAVIVGHDWGGVLAWFFASNYPELTERLIVLNAPHPAALQRELRSLKQLRMSWYVFFFQLPWLPEYVLLRDQASAIGRLFQQTALQQEAFPEEVTKDYRVAMSKPGAMTAALNYYRQIARRSVLPRKGGALKEVVSAPTLLIWGEQDSALSIELTQNLAAWVPDLRVEYLPQSGHWVQQEQPEQVNRLMQSFLGAQSPVR